MPGEKILLACNDRRLGEKLIDTILNPASYQVKWVSNHRAAVSSLHEFRPDLAMIGEQLEDIEGIDLAGILINTAPLLPLVMIADGNCAGMTQRALRIGAADCICSPFQPEEVLRAINRSMERYAKFKKLLHNRARERTDALKRRLDVLETLGKVGRSVTASLELDYILTSVVDAAVNMTEAEEGSLLLLDEESGELYMRAARNFQDEFVHTFRLPINDTLAGEVVRTGKPVILDDAVPKKIKTSYLVRSLLYVPLRVHGRVIGVLGVDNRHNDKPFLEPHLTLVAALADYAAIAIENARLYNDTEVERQKLETILTRIGDGVIVISNDQRIILANRIACEVFGLVDTDVVARSVEEVFSNEQLLEMLRNGHQKYPYRSELTLDDGRTMITQLAQIPDVGLAVTMQDITHLKELDRIKSDFVHTVSHDLRSPLTAILGYVELIQRVGPTNDQQTEFIKRVQISVRNITALINDLLDLGRIESGFDARKEFVPLSLIVEYAMDDLANSLKEKGHQINIEIPGDIPKVFGDPSRLRQLVVNILGNAVRYTPKGGQIGIRLRAETGQVILQVIDNGPGIPPSDQPYIFDKFYRASNIPRDVPGSGLGLAIVKSIVENHQGRVWVDSTLGQGATFTVVLPTADDQL
jgi:PAS domain S-box-containing protein